MKIQPYSLHGNIKAVASKSHLQRAILLAFLSEGETIINNYSESGDVLSMKSAIEALGASVCVSDSQVRIVPPLSFPKTKTEISAGESGLALRLLAPVVSILPKPVIISGNGTLIQRPLLPLLKSLSAAGISYSCDAESLPLKILSAPTNKNIVIDASFSSQPVSGLLMVLPLLPFDTIFTIENAVSKPYIEITLDLMKFFGVTTENYQMKEFYISGNQSYNGCTYTTEGDWSGTANFLVAAAISGEITIDCLNLKSKQADMEIIQLLQRAGAHVRCIDNKVSVSKNQIHPLNADLTDCPDLFPPLAVLAAAAGGTSVFYGTNRLRHKESDRAETIVKMIESLGGKANVEGDRMMIYGKRKLLGGEVDGYNDHRIIMASAIAATLCENPVTITHHESVGKSWPTFFQDLEKCMRVL